MLVYQLSTYHRKASVLFNSKTVFCSELSIKEDFNVSDSLKWMTEKQTTLTKLPLPMGALRPNTFISCVETGVREFVVLWQLNAPSTLEFGHSCTWDFFACYFLAKAIPTSSSAEQVSEQIILWDNGSALKNWIVSNQLSFAVIERFTAFPHCTSGVVIGGAATVAGGANERASCIVLEAIVMDGVSKGAIDSGSNGKLIYRSDGDIEIRSWDITVRQCQSHEGLVSKTWLING